MSDAGGASRCTNEMKKNRGSGDVKLPVLRTGGEGVRLGGSRTGRWRAVVLTLVNVAIGIHILQWLYQGTTLSPVEPSESMKTLEEGVVNAGFVFFVAALTATMVFGRFFCGWGCHIVSIQDACSWVMSRVGVRPKPFRSRLMLWIPLGIGTYMFVWPNVRRHVLTPLVGDEFGRLPSWLGTMPPIDRITQEFMVADFWETFAPWYVAIPFIFVVGVAIVYFLGNKGFCTYGCPYGGFFAPLDLVAPGKIRVTDACEGCGHCTAVCTSNVRVHEEVRDFGMVVNPGCMKCMDCVNTCPNDALYFGFGKPSLLAKPRTLEAKERVREKKRSLKQYDLTRGQEWLAVVLFVLLLWGYRSFLNEVPLLMAVGMASIGVFVLWTLWKMARVANVRVQSLQLKLKGRVKPAGAAFVVLGAVYIACGVWGGIVRVEIWRAEQAYAKLEESGPTIPQAIQPGFDALPEHRSAATEAIKHYTRARSFTSGGIGWGHSKEGLARLAYMHAVMGDFEQAERCTRDLLARQKPNDNIVIDLARIMQRRGQTMETIIPELKRWLAIEPTLTQVRNELAQALRATGKADEAISEFAKAAAELAKSKKTSKFVGATKRDHAYFMLSGGDREAAAGLFREAITAAEENLDVLVPSAAGLAQCGDTAGAEAALNDADRIAQDSHDVPVGTVLNIARGYMALGKKERAEVIARRVASDKKDPAGMLQGGIALAQFGQMQDGIIAIDDAAVAAERMTKRHLGSFRRPGAAGVNISAGGVMLQAGRAERGRELIEQGVRLGAGRAIFKMQAASQYLSNGDAPRAIPLLEAAAAERRRDASLRHDLAVAYTLANRSEDAIKTMRSAAEMSPTSAEFAAKLAQLYRETNQVADAEKWEAEAARRGGGTR